MRNNIDIIQTSIIYIHIYIYIYIVTVYLFESVLVHLFNCGLDR